MHICLCCFLFDMNINYFFVQSCDVVMIKQEVYLHTGICISCYQIGMKVSSIFQTYNFFLNGGDYPYVSFHEKFFILFFTHKYTTHKT